MNEHDYEPVLGCRPASKGETILWQGAPNWHLFARRAMRVRLVAGYFVLLAVWGISGRLSSGMDPWDVVVSTARLGALGVVAIALLVLFAWLVARTTLITITSRRVVMRSGIALPITIQIPFHRIESAGTNIWPDGGGDIALTLMPREKLGYLVLCRMCVRGNWRRPSLVCAVFPMRRVWRQSWGGRLAASLRNLPNQYPLQRPPRPAT